MEEKAKVSRGPDIFMFNLNFFTICWWVFIIIWALSSFSVKPSKERQDWGGRLFTFAFLTVTFLLLAGEFSWWGMNERIWPYSQPMLFLAKALTLAGLATLIWARWSLGRNWSAIVTFREQHELVQHGPYRFVRHPIYTGMMLMVAGTATVLGNSAGLLSVVICFLGHWSRGISRRHTRNICRAQKRSYHLFFSAWPRATCTTSS
jgi:protein-S-isoprenylcysteine O-methyltransferase Ste14